MGAVIFSHSLIFRLSTQELAPFSFPNGCRSITGPVPPLLLIRIFCLQLIVTYIVSVVNSKYKKGVGAFLKAPTRYVIRNFSGMFRQRQPQP